MASIDWGPEIRKQAITLCLLLLVNTLVAVAIYAITDNSGFLTTLVMSQCIGLSCELIGKITHYALQRLGVAKVYPWAFLGALCGLPVGSWMAFQLGFPPGGSALEVTLGNTSRYVWLTALVCFLFYSLNTVRRRKRELDELRREAELRELAAQKAALNAQLRALQAQIEPHFLFNTLANLHSLIGRDDEAARSLLDRLNEYLRATLAHSRAEHATLGGECDVLRAYLAIHAQRMGGRLGWQVQLPDALVDLPFPPMLLQPLVENAIIHGIEPKIAGGRVRLQIGMEGAFLCCRVSDDGAGIQVAGSSGGVGLVNVRERLAHLYGPSARLEIRDNEPCGVIAELWMPLNAPVP